MHRAYAPSDSPPGDPRDAPLCRRWTWRRLYDNFHKYYGHSCSRPIGTRLAFARIAPCWTWGCLSHRYVKKGMTCVRRPGASLMLLRPLPSPIGLPYVTVIESLRPIRPYIQATLNGLPVYPSRAAFPTLVQ